MTGDSANRDGKIVITTSIIILFCGDLFPSTVGSCCPDCHRADRPNLITLYPRKDGGSDIDFTLPVQGLVCCDCYDAARALPNSVWLKHVEKRGRRRMSGFDRPVYVPPSASTSTRSKTKQTKRVEEPEIPSMEDFLWSIRRPTK